MLLSNLFFLFDLWKTQTQKNRLTSIELNLDLIHIEVSQFEDK